MAGSRGGISNITSETTAGFLRHHPSTSFLGPQAAQPVRGGRGARMRPLQIHPVSQQPHVHFSSAEFHCTDQKHFRNGRKEKSLPCS